MGWFDDIANKIRTAKDWGLSESGKHGINRIYLHPKRIGNMTSLNIDTSEKHISASVLLSGEEKTLSFEIDYEAEIRDGKTHFKIKSLSSDREWVTRLGREFGVRRTFVFQSLPFDLQLL